MIVKWANFVILTIFYAVRWAQGATHTQIEREMDELIAGTCRKAGKPLPERLRKAGWQ
jgi:hypothetical protein